MSPAEEDTVVVRMQADYHPGMLPRVLDEIEEGQWDIIDATVVSDDNSNSQSSEFTLSRRTSSMDEADLDSDVFASVDDAAFALSEVRGKTLNPKP